MSAGRSHDDAAIILAAFEARVLDLFKVFAESLYTGEPEREAAARFRRGLVSAKKARDLALAAAKDTDPA
jgi:hypothetical protein